MKACYQFLTFAIKNEFIILQQCNLTTPLIYERTDESFILNTDHNIKEEIHITSHFAFLISEKSIEIFCKI